MTPGHVVDRPGVVSAERAHALPRRVVVLRRDTLGIACDEKIHFVKDRVGGDSEV